MKLSYSFTFPPPRILLARLACITIRRVIILTSSCPLSVEWLDRDYLALWGIDGLPKRERITQWRVWRLRFQLDLRLPTVEKCYIYARRRGSSSKSTTSIIHSNVDNRTKQVVQEFYQGPDNEIQSLNTVVRSVPICCVISFCLVIGKDS